ncbi:MAG TPA: hypothetical protein VMZ29_16515 [Candidatus Bathyarchaeia archaeon]|nr:hypothetical protein [Candidatus Bathyarchaeia archaeon]
MSKNLIDIIERVIVDNENPTAYKNKPLSSYKIPEINIDERDKIGTFKIIKEDIVKFYATIKAYEEHVEVVYYLEEGEWVAVLYHSLYEYEKDFDHGKEREYYSKPLIPFIYYEPNNRIYFIEDEDGALYCSLDKKRWFLQLLDIEDRPYFEKIENMQKIFIKYEK